MDSLDAFGGDEDAALRYAIALSLQESGGASPKEPIELDSGEDEGQGRSEQKPKLSSVAKEPDNSPTRQTPENASLKDTPSNPEQPTSATPSSSTALGLAGMDRKKMEEERLARLRQRSVKRKASDSQPEEQDRRQRPKVDFKPRASLATKATPHLPYPKGIVKKTWVAGCPRKDDIKIEEVLQKDELELAMISSFQWDEEWLLSKIEFSQTKVILVAFASDEDQQEQMKANVPRGAPIKFCFPPMMSTGNMHSKLQLLKYPKYLRVVIPTGNFVPYDWGENGIIENMVFLIDLPRIDDPKSKTSNKLGPFGDELCYFLRAQNLDESLVNSLANYDFSEANHYRFIHTIAASHAGDEWRRTGYCGLGRAITSLGLNTTDEIEVDLMTSSLGSLNIDLVLAIYYAAQGDNGLKEYGMRGAKSGKTKESISAKIALKDRFRIYFPSHDTVVKSRGGKNAAGTICAHAKWWDSATFPRELFRDSRSVRTGILVHSKLMMVRHRRSGKSKAAYAYIGSANLSESAWGRLTKERGTGNPKITCRNWECGVVVPIPSRDSSEEGAGSSDPADFSNVIPVPIEIPGEAYGATASKRPWFFLDN
ncbi:phospholipase D/nuclease [Annulohypoxylon truncatum]|uniref:phospholipase D/nuclease n=1 Tax=Annulohypoxylon truncatum TaxID=327061 RepID=UPI00200756FE|nr:phospholipase D/nuclease [Annulohypoxylon truncatum]KAI1213279.1 phospholipase D/nuclease [Annulohypoxylon truncatum]